MRFPGICFCLALCARAVLGAGAPATTAPEIRLGMIAPLTGRESEWGKRFSAGVEAAVRQANAEGAVPEGARLTVESRDSRGRATNGALAAESLCDENRVAALIPAPGCEGAARAVTMAGRLRKVPVLGAGLIEETRRPPARLVFSLRASLADEVGELLRVAAKSGGAGLTVIALDEQTLVGAETLRAVRRSAAAGASPPMLTPVAPGDLHAVRRAAQTAAAQGGAVVLVLPTVEAAIAIRTLHERSEKTSIFSSSLAPADWLARLAGSAGGGVTCASPLPHYRDERLPLARAFRAAMGSAAVLDGPAFEGFALVRLYLEGLRRAGGTLGAENFAAALETLDSEWEGLSMRFDTGNRQGLSRVWLLRLDRDGSLQPVAP